MCTPANPPRPSGSINNRAKLVVPAGGFAHLSGDAGGKAVKPRPSVFVECVELAQGVLMHKLLRFGLWLEESKPRL
jgi:hypothetical protein